MSLQLSLYAMPATSVLGFYDANKNGKVDDVLPTRMRFLHPKAAYGFLRMAGSSIIVSDMFRSAEASLAARAQKTGVQPPAFSAHNYGLAIDVAVDETLKANGWKHHGLLAYMAEYGWYCYRRDEARGAEDWHFNYLGDNASHILPKLRTSFLRRNWSDAAELLILSHYKPEDFMLVPAQVQALLKGLKMYGGEVDGVIGPISQQAVAAFARAWGLPRDHKDPKFQRVLAYVTAPVVLTPNVALVA